MGACGSKICTCCCPSSNQQAKPKENFTQPFQAQYEDSSSEKMAVTDKSRETFKADYEGSDHGVEKQQQNHTHQKNSGIRKVHIDYLETLNIGCTVSKKDVTYNIMPETNEEKPPKSKLNLHHKNENAGDKLAKTKRDDEATLILDMLTKTAKSVGIIRGPGECQGTGFLLKDGMVMTAAHVINDLKDLNGNLDENLTREKKISIQFDYKQQSDVNRQPCFYFLSEIPYISLDIDVVILRIRLESDTSNKLPVPLETFGPVQQNMKGEMIGHPNGEPQRIDRNIERYVLSSDNYQLARRWSIDMYNENGYAGIEDTRKILFHCGFAHGASGSPGVYADITKQNCEVVWMLLEGYPGFYHRRLRPDERATIPKNFLIEQGITMKAIWEDMLGNDKTELCQMIFGHRNERFHPIRDPSSSMTLA